MLTVALWGGNAVLLKALLVWGHLGATVILTGATLANWPKAARARGKAPPE